MKLLWIEMSCYFVREKVDIRIVMVRFFSLQVSATAAVYVGFDIF